MNEQVTIIVYNQQAKKLTGQVKEKLNFDWRKKRNDSFFYCLEKYIVNKQEIIIIHIYES